MEARGCIPVGPPVPNPLPSYWHNPKSPLANTIENEPATPEVTYDYAIIGSGISGAMIAYNLLHPPPLTIGDPEKSKPAPKIIMLEAREACGGATGRNGGHTKAASYRTYLQHREELGKEEALKIARLEFENIKASHELARTLGLDCESHECTTVDLVYDEETFERGKEAIGALRKDAEVDERKEGGAAWYKIYGAQEAATGFFAAPVNENPEIQRSEKLVGAFEYVAGRINAYKLCTGILKHCVQKGLRLCTNTPVHKILPSSSPSLTQPSPPTAEDTDGTQLYEIYTQYFTISARSVILATNGYTPYLLSQLQSLIVPLRGQITAQRPGPDAKLPSPLPTTYSFIYQDGYEYMIPRPIPSASSSPKEGEAGQEQHIIIGGGLARLPQSGASEYGTIDDSSLHPQISSYLNHTLVNFFGAKNWGEANSPSSESSKRVVQEWTGIMGTTADGRPFVGQVPDLPGVWISAGFNGHGMVLCLKSAEALVQRLGGRWPGWFPSSFELSEKRLASARFRGRTDMGGCGTNGEPGIPGPVPETRGGSVEGKL